MPSWHARSHEGGGSGPAHACAPWLAWTPSDLARPVGTERGRQAAFPAALYFRSGMRRTLLVALCMSGGEADVAIVGYGPVGQALAILLGQRGWRVRVVERWPEAFPLPRAVHFDHEVARILQAAGVADTLAPRTVAASVYEWRNARGETLILFGRDAERSLSGWPESSMFCQPELERILDERARSLPCVSVERGVEAVRSEEHTSEL